MSAVLVVLFLLVGLAAASRADCCPPLDASGPDVAAAGCCGHCPTVIAPTQEPASLSARAAHVPAAVVAGAFANLVPAGLAVADRMFPADRTPSPPPGSRAAPLRL
jgi:hypothetical protein